MEFTNFYAIIKLQADKEADMGFKLDLIINENYSKLNDIDLHILHFVQTNLKLCTTISIADLARKCNVSTATVLRTTQKLDFSGYSEFKFFLKNDTEKVNVSTLDMIEIISQDISQTIKLFKQTKEINEICRIIDKSDNIYA